MRLFKYLVQLIAGVLARIYAAISRARNFCYDRGIFRTHRVALPVICIGNLNVGGNGKTPLCIYLVHALQARGLKPVVLSRGYGGSLKGPHVVGDSDSASSVGDEPILIFRKTLAPVVVSRNRVAGAQFIERNALGQYIILDDGLQHRRLARDVNIVTVNISTAEAINDFLAARLLPLGLFREHREEGLRRTQMLIFNDRSVSSSAKSIPEELLRVVPEHIKVYRAYLQSQGIQSVLHEDELKKGVSVVAVCAIANPEGFFQSLKVLGFSLVATVHYRDHYAKISNSIAELKLQYPDIPLVCTEKDVVKIDKAVLDNVYVLRSELRVLPQDAFEVALLKLSRK